MIHEFFVVHFVKTLPVRQAGLDPSRLIYLPQSSKRPGKINIGY
jgi:hypothetical protein